MQDRQTATRVPAETLRAFAARLLGSVGFPEEDAGIAADVIVASDLRGVDTHGVTRLAGYVRMVDLGHLNPRPRWQVVRDGPTTATVDGDRGLGHVLAYRGMRMALDRARQNGIAAVAVRNHSHNGMNAYYPLMAIQEGMIGLVCTQGPAIVPPFGSREPSLSTNPLSIGAPAGRHDHVLVDMATTVVAGGKIRLALKTGASIPATWALDRDGQPTTDPAAALDGFFQWLGGYKGYALAVMVEVLAGVLSGGLFGRQVPPLREFGRDLVISSCLLVAIDVERFMPLDAFRSRLDALVDDLTSTERAPGVERVLVPGQPEREHQAERLARGIPLSPAVCAELEQLAARFGLPSPVPAG